MNPNTSPGSRKLTIARETANYILIGLVVTLLAVGIGVDKDLCRQAFEYYLMALCGKDAAFIYGNAKEHKAKAKSAHPVSPTQTSSDTK